MFEFSIRCSLLHRILGDEPSSGPSSRLRDGRFWKRRPATQCYGLAHNQQLSPARALVGRAGQSPTAMAHAGDTTPGKKKAKPLDSAQIAWPPQNSSLTRGTRTTSRPGITSPFARRRCDKTMIGCWGRCRAPPKPAANPSRDGIFMHVRCISPGSRACRPEGPRFSSAKTAFSLGLASGRQKLDRLCSWAYARPVRAGGRPTVFALLRGCPCDNPWLPCGGGYQNGAEAVNPTDRLRERGGRQPTHWDWG